MIRVMTGSGVRTRRRISPSRGAAAPSRHRRASSSREEAVRTVTRNPHAGGGDDETTYYYAYDELGDDKLPTRCTGNKQCSVNENFEGWQAASER